MNLKLLAAALLLGTANIAHTADAIVDEVVIVESAYNWSGLYVGAQVGYAWGDAQYTNIEYDAYANADPDGFFGGLYAGYNYQFNNNVVLGIDADINLASIDGSAIYYEGDSQYDDHEIWSEVEYSGAVRARLGYAMDRWLPYVAGGVSFAKYNIVLEQPGNHTDFDLDRTFTGWTIGGGFEYAATDNVIIRAEYRFSDFGDWDPDTDWADGENISLKTHDIRLGIAYKF